MDPYKPQFVCKLRKTLYGLKLAPRAWFEKLKNALLARGFETIIYDSSLIVLKANEEKVYLPIYFDDILISGLDTTYTQSLIQDLNTKFSLKDLRELSFFIGIKADRNQCGLHLTQSKFIV